LIGVRFARKSLSAGAAPQAHIRASPLSFILNTAILQLEG
jgi:hypothetical protein